MKDMQVKSTMRNILILFWLAEIWGELILLHLTKIIICFKCLYSLSLDFYKVTLRRLKYKEDIYLNILIKVLFITVKYWKQSKHPTEQEKLIMAVI